MKAKQRPVKWSIRWSVLIGILAAVCSSQAGNTYVMKKSVIASGGQTVGGRYVLTSAIGQHVTERSTSATYQLTAGFFQENRDLIFVNEFESNN